MDTIFASTLALFLCATVTGNVLSDDTTDVNTPLPADNGPKIKGLRDIILNFTQSTGVCQSDSVIELCGNGTYWNETLCEVNDQQVCGSGTDWNVSSHTCDVDSKVGPTLIGTEPCAKLMR